jgi:hypothetical protein
MPDASSRAKLRNREYSRRRFQFHRTALTIGSDSGAASVLNACIESASLCFACTRTYDSGDMPSSFEQTTDDYDLLNMPPFLNRLFPSNKPHPSPDRMTLGQDLMIAGSSDRMSEIDHSPA